MSVYLFWESAPFIHLYSEIAIIIRSHRDEQLPSAESKTRCYVIFSMPTRYYNKRGNKKPNITQGWLCFILAFDHLILLITSPDEQGRGSFYKN